MLEKQGAKKSGWLRGLWEVLRFAAVTLLIVVPIRTYVAQPFIVSGMSMAPSFNDGEYLIVDSLTYFWRPPGRGEVVVFRFPKEPAKFFIKRIIGLPGETVVTRNNQVHIRRGSEEFIFDLGSPTAPAMADGRFTLKESEYFVLGDNRSMSLDSRVWGAVPEQNIKGRVILRLFPLDQIAWLPARTEILGAKGLKK